MIHLWVVEQPEPQLEAAHVAADIRGNGSAGCHLAEKKDAEACGDDNVGGR